MGYKLYGSGGSRWVKPYWTLKELGVPFEAITTSIMQGDTRKPEFLAINPYGKIPAFIDGDTRLFESSAICTYLAEKHADKGLIPKEGTLERAQYNQWVSTITTELEQPLWTMTKYAFMYTDVPHRAGAVETAKQEFFRIAGVTENLLQDYVVGNRFTVADIMMAYTLNWSTVSMITGGNLLEKFPKLTAYMNRMTARPFFPKELYG